MEEKGLHKIDERELNISQLFQMLPGMWQEHSKRTASAASYLFGVITQNNDLYEEEQPPYAVWEVEQAVMYHDIGILMIPDTLIAKGIACTAKEKDLVRRHAAFGASIIERYRLSQSLSRKESALWRLAAEVAISHHECWNGKGYPHGEMATAIPLISRITAIVNYYDIALRDNKNGLSPTLESSLKKLEKGAGIQFDPRLVAKFKTTYINSDEFRDIFTGTAVDGPLLGNAVKGG